MVLQQLHVRRALKRARKRGAQPGRLAVVRGEGKRRGARAVPANYDGRDKCGFATQITC